MAVVDRFSTFTPYLSRGQTTFTPAASLLHEYTSHLQLADAQFASRASNAADAIAMIAPMPEAATIVSAWFVPNSSQAGSATNFAQMKLINVGTAGSGTTVIGSYTLSAAGQGASAGQPVAFTPSSGTALSVSAGEALAISYISQANGIAIVPHSIGISYRLR